MPRKQNECAILVYRDMEIFIVVMVTPTYARDDFYGPLFFFFYTISLFNNRL